MISEESPALVETARGLSVAYGGRFLYSRYDPTKAAIAAINSLHLLPETLVLCFSPILGYGLAELLARLPPSCMVLAVERDERLMALSLSAIDQAILEDPRFRYARASEPEAIISYIDGFWAKGPYRRCARVELSGGASLNPEFYSNVTRLADDYVSRFWRNRVTLIKLGRNYARNFFRNLATLADRASLVRPRTDRASVNRTILVAGAGPSLETALDFMRDRRGALYIFAVDTALPTLRDAGIVPDAVVLVESQYWIEKAFIGFRGTGIPLFADLTARPGAIASFAGQVSFFRTEYAEANYLARFKNSCVDIPTFPPLGSVGLTAIALAGYLAEEGIPVLFTGLDFAWGRGYTHSRGSPAPRASLDGTTRLTPLSGSHVATSQGAEATIGRDGKYAITDPALRGYAETLGHAFARDPNLFDVGGRGIETGCASLSLVEAVDLVERFADKTHRADVTRTDETYTDATRTNVTQSDSAQQKDAIMGFLEGERKRLEELVGILTGDDAGNNARVDDAGSAEANSERIKRLITDMDYLFLHFPDGHRGYEDTQSFLNRVRVEAGYFQKILAHL